jgi:hypothetical protein
VPVHIPGGTLAATGTLACALAVAVSGPAGATSTGHHGQPNQSCGGRSRPVQL